MKILKYKADIRTLSFLSLYFISLFYAFFFMPLVWYTILPMFIFLCTISFMVSITIHNTVHCPIFYNRFLNKINFIMLSIAFGSPASGFVPGHNLSHHKHLLTNKDNCRTDKMRFKWNFLNQFLFFFYMIPSIVTTESRFVKYVGKKRSKWYWQYQTEVIALWAWKLLFIYLNWKLAIVFLILPQIYAVWGIFGTNFWQHDGCDGSHPYNHSRNFRGKVFNFLVCNNGYHGAHHNKPNMHWSLYPEYHEKEIAPHLHPNLNLNLILPYLFKTCIYPAKRVDYLGNPLILPPPVKDEDWVLETSHSSMEATDLGVENAEEVQVEQMA